MHILQFNKVLCFCLTFILLFSLLVLLSELLMSLNLVKFSELGEEEDGDNTPDLESVKALTARLKLQTRRPSYQEWALRVQGRPWMKNQGGSSEDKVVSSQGKCSPVGSVCGFESMDKALEWIRKELREIEAADHLLARQLMLLRSRISQLKVEQACERHKEMLDDATFDLEGCDEDSDLLCNIPPRAAFTLSTPLKHIGVTRMNINSRRFSLC
ncbi:protein FAM167B [Spea bombifrons]|uniref:protein FAM167B n=1 Tax=Spea bombifrons TaxID=233779 RepID=UPI00234B8E06|nr:protein FAM167B [Spea bombifrons]